MNQAAKRDPADGKMPWWRTVLNWLAERKRRLCKQPGLHLAWLSALLAFAGAVTLIVLQLREEKSAPDSTTLGLFVLAAAFGFAFLSPGQAVKALRRVTRFKVGSVELGLAEIKRAERVRPPQEDDGVHPDPRPRGAGYDDCVERLQDRLERTRVMLELKARRENYAEIAEELRLSELLNRDEETFVLDLLSNYDPISDDWSSGTEQKFLDATWAFASRFRALVWDRWVRQQLKCDKWFIADYEQPSGHRPDFLAYRDESWILIAARVGGLPEKEPDDLDVPVKRLTKPVKGPPITSRLIVMPDTGRGVVTENVPQGIRESVKLVTLAEISGESRRSGAS